MMQCIVQLGGREIAKGLDAEYAVQNFELCRCLTYAESLDKSCVNIDILDMYAHLHA